MSRGGRIAAALVAVVVMIGAAVLVRDALTGDGGTDNTDDGGGTDGNRPTLLCAEELGDVCTRLESNEDVNVVIEPAAATAERLPAAPPPPAGDAGGGVRIAAQN